MKKVKAVKKIPKYDGGGITGPGKLSAPKYNFDLNNLSGNTGSSGGGVTPRGIISSGNEDKFNWTNAAALAGNAAGTAAGMLGIELGDVAHAANLIGDVANLIPGVGPYIGAGIKTIGALSGAGGNVDEITGEITKSSGLTRWLGWGRSDESLAQKSNRITNRNIAAQQSSRMQMEWKNNPNVELQPAVLAKDGGVISKKIKITNTIPEELVHAKVSKGELYYDPYNKTLSRVPGSSDKPNTDDNVDAFLAKGGMVVTNNNKQPLINGKTQAIALAPMVDKPNKNMSKGTIEARDRIIKKVTRLNELSKNEGNRTNNIVYANKGYNGLVEHYVDADGVSHSYVFKIGSEKDGTAKYYNYGDVFDYKGKTFKVTGLNKAVPYDASETTDTPLTTLSTDSSNQGGFGHRDLSLTANTAGGFGPTLKYGYLGYLSTRQFFPVGKIDYTSQFEGWDKFYTKPVASKPTGVAKSGSSKTSSNKESVPQQGGHFRVQDSIGHRYGYPLLTIADAAEQITTPDKIDMNRIKKDIEYLDGQSEDGSTSNKSNFDLSNLYRGLSAIAPLFDRVRPRTTTLNRPTFKPIPVDVDPTNLLLDAQLGYALNNYNTSRGGFTAGQQLAAANVAASNLATQRANIHQWEKEQELKNITQNIMSYNDYSKLLAEIGNTEIDINDRNRAAANTINDTNRKSALNTLGSIAKEMKQEKIDAQDRERKYTMLEPLIREVYENSDELLPLLQGKIKKVKKTKKSTKTEKE